MYILEPRQEEIKKTERIQLQKLKDTLVKFGADEEHLANLEDSIRQLDEFFLLVVVGEFNSGKSAFINALLGQPLLEEGVTPTTKKINLIHFGKQKDQKFVDDDQQEILLPIEWLKEISIVDTPGTNAIIRSHEEITSKFIPRSDLVLFITSSDRPFTQSEQQFLAKIHHWGKKIIFIINKIDILQDENQLNQIYDFVLDNAEKLLETEPEIFPISAKMALNAKQGNPSDWEKSNFEKLENYIKVTLDEQERVKLKFLNPIGVGINLSQHYRKIASDRLDIMKHDISMLKDIEEQMRVYEKDMQRDFSLWLASLENIIYEMEKRGIEYFDETFRLERVFDLINKDRIAREFESNVVGELPKQIEEEVIEIIDWMVESDLKQWQIINEFIINHQKSNLTRSEYSIGIGSFQYNRERLLNAISRETQNIVETYDKKKESNSIAESAKIAVAASAAIEIGAVGLGTAVAFLASTASADVTGILLASVVAALGLFVIPSRKKLAKEKFQNKITELRKNITETLSIQFSNELDKSVLRINSALKPFTRFIRAENEKMAHTKEQLEELYSELMKLREDVEKT